MRPFWVGVVGVGCGGCGGGGSDGDGVSEDPEEALQCFLRLPFGLKGLGERGTWRVDQKDLYTSIGENH